MNSLPDVPDTVLRVRMFKNTFMVEGYMQCVTRQNSPQRKPTFSDLQSILLSLTLHVVSTLVLIDDSIGIHCPALKRSKAERGSIAIAKLVMFAKTLKGGKNP